MDYINLSDLAGKIPKLDMPNLPPIDPPSLGYKIPHMETIDPEDTIMGDIKHKIQEQNELAAKQIEVLVQQNQLLSDNYLSLIHISEPTRRS